MKFSKTFFYIKFSVMVNLLFLIITYGLTTAICFGQLKPPPQNYVLHFGGLQTAMLASSSLTYTNQATLETWIYLEASSPNGIIMGNNSSPALRFNASGLPYFTVNGVNVTAPAALPLRTWTHLAGTRDAAAMRLLINGQEVASAVVSGSISVGGTFSIGGGTVENGGSTDSGINAALRQVRVWNRALTAAEITGNAGVYLVGTEANLIAYFPLDDAKRFTTRNLAVPSSMLQIGLRPYGAELQGEPKWATPQMVETGPYFSLQELPFTTSGQSVGGYDGRLIDFDSDGDLDVLMNDFESGSTTPQPLLAFRNDGNGNFTNATTAVLGNPPPTEQHARDYAIADFNGDGRMDAFMADHGPDFGTFPGGQSRILIQSADGRLVDETATRIPQVLAFTHHVSVGDIDGDGDIDIYMSNLGPGNYGPRFYINNGSGVFAVATNRIPTQIANINPPFTASELVDVDNDGDLDLVLGATDYAPTEKDVLLLNNGSGQFTNAPDNAMPLRRGGAAWSTVEIAHADVNNDGYADLLMSTIEGTYKAPFIELLINNRNGTFSEASGRISQTWESQATTGTTNLFWIKIITPTDFNNDGLIDFIATLDIQTGSPRLFINKGQGNFVDATGLLPPGAPGVVGAAMPGDLDNDGDIDIFMPAAYWGRYYTVRQQKKYNLLKSPFDFDGDGKSDVSVFRPSNSVWYVSKSSDNAALTAQWGIATDKIVPADYDGDGKTDYAVFRDGFWYILLNGGGFQGSQWGAAGDIPFPADFDGDGKADLAVFRNGTWFVLKSAGGTVTQNWGSAGDIPVVADYDADGKADFAVYRNGIWYVLFSTGGNTAIQWGIAGDKTVPGDYNGDGKADYAVFRNGFWYILLNGGGFQGAQWGTTGDLASPADYDGDGKTDLAVFRAGTWYIQRTTAGVQIINFGSAGDKPVPNAFVP